MGVGGDVEQLKGQLQVHCHLGGACMQVEVYLYMGGSLSRGAHALGGEVQSKAHVWNGAAVFWLKRSKHVWHNSAYRVWCCILASASGG